MDWDVHRGERENTEVSQGLRNVENLRATLCKTPW